MTNVPFSTISSPSIVAINNYDEKRLSGVFYHPYYAKEKTFDNAMQLLLLQEQLLDDTGYPQAFSQKRGFGSDLDQKEAAETGIKRDVEVNIPCGKLATFSVKVVFRKNASWQGSLVWMDKNLEISFRSALELMLLIDNALSD